MDQVVARAKSECPNLHTHGGVAMIRGFASDSIVPFIVALILSTTAAAQDWTPPMQANPAPGCSATPAELEANKKVAMDYFRTSGEARVALLDPAYKEHNPAATRLAKVRQVSDYELAKEMFLGWDKARLPTYKLYAEPLSPTGNLFEIVTAECDIVTVVHRAFKMRRSGNYEAFAFDSFRVKGGKLVERSLVRFPSRFASECRRPALAGLYPLL